MQNTQMFSLFEAPITNTQPYKNITLENVYQSITGSNFKEATQQLRLLNNKTENRQFKAKHFPYVTFSGIFTQRRENHLEKHSGLIAIDFDHISNVEVLKMQLLKDLFFETELLFTSPNGNGLKWIIKIHISETISHKENFRAIFNYIQKTYSIEIDKACSDVCRATFLCYDPEAFLHPKYGRMNRQFPPEIWLVNRKNFIPAKWIDKPIEKKHYQIENKIKSNIRLHYEIEVVLRRIEVKKLDLTVDYEDWRNLGFAFSDEFGEAGRGYFHRSSIFYSTYNQADTDKQYNECLKSFKSGITIKTFFAMAREAGVNIKV